MNILKAIYNFLVGDMIILVGILLTLAILVLLNNVSQLAGLKGGSAIVMIVGTLLVLGLTLGRELLAHKKTE